MSVEPGKIRRAIGCMTGTSLDALDIALIRASGKGLSLSVTIEGFISVSLGDLAPKLRMVAEQHPFSAGELKKLEYDFSLFHLKAIQKLKKDRAIDLIILHGQTIYHNPPYSWQMINPSVIAHGLRVNTVHDLRAADLAIGGEGAPITPLADFILFRNKSMRTAIVNLGGFCNITTIPKFADNKINAESLFKWSRCITGKDICLCNQLLDRISRDGFKQEYDEGGKNAATGRILAKAYAELYGKLLLQSNSGKSLGSHDSTVGWFDNYSSVENPADLARTACAAIAAVICQDTKCDLMVLAGGGVHNKTLINELRRKATFRVQSSENYGINPSQREALEIAVLGLLCQDRVPITLPQITGVMDSPVSGSWVLP
jgi:anhydro-N-acetylmuramic acid kinase